jgi:SPP1 gp7 family putative phage head morphogenesis protein
VLGVNAGRYQVESAVMGQKAAIVSTAWDIANAAVIAWLVGNGDGTGIVSYLDTLTNSIMATTIAQAAPLVSAWAANGQPMSALVDALTQTGFSDTRARRIALTEVTRAYAKGNREAWRASGVVERRRWATSADELVCPVCGPLAGQERALDEPFTPEIDDPPAHVQCRCWILPVVE